MIVAALRIFVYHAGEGGVTYSKICFAIAVIVIFFFAFYSYTAMRQIWVVVVVAHFPHAITNGTLKNHQGPDVRRVISIEFFLKIFDDLISDL